MESIWKLNPTQPFMMREGSNYVKDPFSIITSLPELYFWLKKFILLVQTNKFISMSYVAVQVA